MCTTEKPSKTAYDDAFHTLLYSCSELIIPVVNQAFGGNYCGHEKIDFAANDYYSVNDKEVDKRITDTSFSIQGVDGVKKSYLLECESNFDSSMLIRVFEYIAKAALRHSIRDEYKLRVLFPKSAVIALRYAQSTPGTMCISFEFPGSVTEYDVSIMKVQQYTLNEIFQRKLLFFLPFYIFCHEKQLDSYDSDEVKLQELLKEYSYIKTKLDDLVKNGEISTLAKYTICRMIVHVIVFIAQKYPKVKKGVEEIMVGRIIEFEEKKIWDEGFGKGREEGLEKGREESEKEREELKRRCEEAEKRNKESDKEREELKRRCEESEKECKEFKRRYEELKRAQ